MRTGLARLRSAPQTDEQRILGAVLSVGPGALASHTSAARLWGVPLATWELEVVMPDRTQSTRAKGVIVHRPRDVSDLRRTFRSKIPVTNPLRLLVDLGGSTAEATVEVALDHLLVERRVTLSAVRAAVARHGMKGRTGIGPLRAVLDRWAFEDQVPNSVFETLVSRLLAANGLPQPVFHLVVAGHEVDFAFPDLGVVVELDGWATHGGRMAFETDRARDLAIQALGRIVVRLTWRAFKRRPAEVIASLAAVLAIRSRAAV